MVITRTFGTIPVRDKIGAKGGGPSVLAQGNRPLLYVISPGSSQAAKQWDDRLTPVNGFLSITSEILLKKFLVDRLTRFVQPDRITFNKYGHILRRHPHGKPYRKG
jgi:hypothetical protein